MLVQVGRFDDVYAGAECALCNRALDRIGSDLIVDSDEMTRSAIACRAIYATTRDELIRVYPANGFATKSVILTERPDYPYEKNGRSFAYKVDGSGMFKLMLGQFASHDLLVGAPNVIPNVPESELAYGLHGQLVYPAYSGLMPEECERFGGVVIGVSRGKAKRVEGVTVVVTNDDCLELVLDRNVVRTGFPVEAIATFRHRSAVLKVASIASKPDAIFELVSGPDGLYVLTDETRGLTSGGLNQVEARIVERIVNPYRFDSMFSDALVARIATKVALNLGKDKALIGQISGEFSQIMKEAKKLASSERIVDEAAEFWSEKSHRVGR